MQAFLLGQPLKMLNQFGYFDAESHGQVFWGMELLPVAFGGKMPERQGKVIKCFD